MRFTKRLKSLSMIVPLLSALSASAQDNEEKAYRKAYAALDLLNRDTASWSQGERNPSIPITDPANREKLLEFAQEHLETALKGGHPFAAAGLCHVYTTEETKVKLRDALIKSIAHKRSKGLQNGLDTDIDHLISVLNLSSKNFVHLQQIELYSPKRAVAVYRHMANDLTNPDTARALEALIRLGDLTESWFPLAEAYFIRSNYQESIKWYEKATQCPQYIHELFESLKAKLEIEGLADATKGDFIRLLHEYALRHSTGKYAFSDHLRYYKFLKENNSHNPDVFKVAALLTKIADDNFQENPEYLYEVARIQQLTYKPDEPKENYDAIADMYLRCAHRGMWKAIEAIIHNPHLLEATGLDNASLVLLRHKENNKGLNKFLEVYSESKDGNNVFPVILSLLLPDNTDFKKTVSSLYESYAPAIDLNFYHLRTTLSEEAMEAKKLWIEHLKGCLKFQGESEPSLSVVCTQGLREPLNTYVDLFIQEFGEEDIDKKFYAYKQWGSYSPQTISRIFLKNQVVQNHIVRLEKEQEEKKAQIAKIMAQKEQLLTQLSPENLFDLAQEYHLLHRVCEIHFDYASQIPSCFREGYFTCLEKAAEKGYKPAFEDLSDLYSNGYQEKNYHYYPLSFKYLHYDNILKMDTLRTPETVARVKRILEQKTS